ncbi:MAG: hypothetical protein DRJ26_03245 [Candidatus Methanomethylicota archaeon]|uniref:Uncharacterized protein n=1 Tax=Thermoproteota archaeon TaxID=2056631 RepID=A0A497F1M7_9CREN|nr:MAG: hypothetical protein DRJ26_03245 [Candidatus Verstraetearchaeota archaeon]
MNWKELYSRVLETSSVDDVLIYSIADNYIEDKFKAEIKRIELDIAKYNRLCDDVKNFFDIKYIFHSKAFNSFIQDPLSHIRDVLKSKIQRSVKKKLSLRRFNQIANLTVRKCIDTNSRILFQNFVALSILYNMHNFDLKIKYPENSWVHLDRKGHQRGGHIPPNYIIDVNGSYYSFFIEAPRPIKWSLPLKSEDSLPLHAAPRPDIMIYRGWVENIVEGESNSTLIKSPDFIIECKEIAGWWKSTRKSKGIKHLTNGEVENVDAVRVIELYRNLYNPGEIILVSKVKVPRGVKYKLSLRGVETIDNTNLNPLAIKRITEIILEHSD